MDDAPVGSLLGLAALGLAAVGGALWAFDPLPPGFSPLLALPPLLGGLWLAVASTFIRDQGLYGALAGRAPAAIHAVARALGVGAAASGLWMLCSLPPAAASEATRALAALDEHCRGPAGERVERGLIPALDGLRAVRPSLPTGVRGEVDAGVRELAARCLPALREAYADPRGTHGSWELLRDRLADPAWRPGPPDDPVWSAPRRARAPPAPSERPVVFDPGAP